MFCFFGENEWTTSWGMFTRNKIVFLCSCVMRNFYQGYSFLCILSSLNCEFFLGAREITEQWSRVNQHPGTQYHGWMVHGQDIFFHWVLIPSYPHHSWGFKSILDVLKSGFIQLYGLKTGKQEWCIHGGWVTPARTMQFLFNHTFCRMFIRCSYELVSPNF